MNIHPVVVEQSFDASVPELWAAITQVDRMTSWFFESIPSFEPEIGFETVFDVHTGGQIFRHRWKVREVIPERHLSYQWEYEGYPGTSTVTFQMAGHDAGSRLKLTHVGTESFPQEIVEFRHESCSVGWKHFIQDRLKAYLDD